MKLFEGNKVGFRFLLGFCFLAPGLMASRSILAEPARNVDEQKFFAKVRKSMHRRGGLGTIQFQTYKQIINYWNDHPNMTDRRWLAYVMATAYHETRLKPVREGFKKTDKAARKHVAWMYRTRRIKLPYHLADRTTGQVYYGRGYVQLTWAANYKKLGRAIGMGDKLYRNPDLVLDPEIASKVLFVGMLRGDFRYSRRRPKGRQKLKLFFNENTSNWYGARNIINGDTRKYGKMIGGYGRKYAKAISFTKAPDEPRETEVEIGPEGPAEEGEVIPVLPGSEVADAGGANEPNTAAQPSGSVHPTPDNTGEETSTPAEESVPESPSETSELPPPPDAAEIPALREEDEVIPILPGATEATEPTETTPIEVEETVLIDTPPSSETEGTSQPDKSPGSESQQPSSPDGSGEPTNPETVTTPETGEPQGETLQPVEDNSWWGSVKSFFAKYKGYVWKS